MKAACSMACLAVAGNALRRSVGCGGIMHSIRPDHVRHASQPWSAACCSLLYRLPTCTVSLPFGLS
jgi:hypothetical protein